MARFVSAVVGSVKDVFRDDRPDDESFDEEMSILEHLEELRSRIIKMALAVLVATVVAFIFTPRIIEFLKAAGPPDMRLQAIQVTENFLVFFNVALTTGVGLALPVLVYQLIAFVAPGLTRREKRLLFSMLPLTLFFFILGAGFGYFVTLRFALTFLLGFMPDLAAVNPRPADFIGFVTTILFWMGLSFELPVVIYVLSKVNVVTPRRLVAWRKYAILLFFVIAAIITPTPDPLNQTLVAAPMIVLYEVGILMARFA